jgi:hypothetical protein
MMTTFSLKALFWPPTHHGRRRMHMHPETTLGARGWERYEMIVR